MLTSDTLASIGPDLTFQNQCDATTVSDMTTTSHSASRDTSAQFAVAVTRLLCASPSIRTGKRPRPNAPTATRNTTPGTVDVLPGWRRYKRLLQHHLLCQLGSPNQHLRLQHPSQQQDQGQRQESRLIT